MLQASKWRIKRDSRHTQEVKRYLRMELHFEKQLQKGAIQPQGHHQELKIRWRRPQLRRQESWTLHGTALQHENTTTADAIPIAKNLETTNQAEVETTISISSLKRIEIAQTKRQTISNSRASQYDPEVAKAAKLKTSTTMPLATRVETTTTEQIMDTYSINEASTDQTTFSTSDSVKKTPSITEATISPTGTQDTIEILSIANKHGDSE